MLALAAQRYALQIELILARGGTIESASAIVSDLLDVFGAAHGWRGGVAQ